MKEGWKIKKLGEVCTIRGGSTPSKSNKDFWEGAVIPWFTVDDIREQGHIIRYTQKHVTELGATKLMMYPIDTVLLCCTASVGEYALTKVEMTSNQQFNGLMINDKKQLLPEYLFYFSSTLKDKLLIVSGKTTIDFVSVSKLKEIEIPIPLQLEQQRIVSILDQAFEKIDALKANAEKNLANAQALFQQVLAKELEPKEGWVKANLEDVVSEDCTLGYGIVQPMNDVEGGVPVVRPVDLKSKYVYLDSLKRVEQKISDAYSRTILKGGELLICVRGSVGVISIASDELKDCNVTRGISPIRFDNKDLAMYMFYYLQSDISRKNLSDKTQGAALQQINIKDLRKLPVSYPIDGIKELVAKIEILNNYCNRLQTNCSRIITECDALKQAILRQAFNGEL